MKTFTGLTFGEVYKTIGKTLLENPEFVTSPRGLKIHEIENAVIEVKDPTQNLFINKVRSVPLKYLAGELLWYFSGRNDLEFISRFSNFWKRIANSDGTCNSAYGSLIFSENKKSQYYWAYKSLVDDKDSRQAILHFNRPYHQYDGNKDFVCTLVGIFHIRNNKLNFTIDMRSNDIFFGLTLLQQQMLKHLQKTSYPDLQLGSYTHIAHSLHLYEKDFNIIRSMVKEDFIDAKTPDLEIDLINIDGSPTYSLLNIIDIIENENSSKVKDMIYLERWLYGNARNEV
jgi:thymidylate synthase